jgi:dihydropteroate synthase
MINNTLNLNGSLVSISKPMVMGILNVTPDSFYANSRKQTERDIHERIEQIIQEGGDLIDVGGYSSRPNAVEVSAVEEMDRLVLALEILKNDYPQIPVSVDTFRASIARQSVEEYGVSLINDIAAGEMDAAMFQTVADLGVPYCMMHLKGTPQTMQQHVHYENMMEEIIFYFSRKVKALRLLGVKDIILDPGFGFSKTLDQNYELMKRLREFDLFDLPLLVGVSRKRMIYELLDATPEQSLEGTTALHTYALLQGASFLRVHDVKAAVDVVKIVGKLK